MQKRRIKINDIMFSIKNGKIIMMKKFGKTILKIGGEAVWKIA